MKLARPAKRPCESCNDCCRIAVSGAARKISSASATSTSTTCAMRSLQCACCRTGVAFRTAATGLLEDAHALGHQAQGQAAADLELRFGQVVERQVHREP